MAAVILFLVPLFHGVVFTGLAYWFKSSKKPAPAGAKKLAAVFALAGALANIILCVTLMEILSGLSVVVGQNEVSLVAHLPAIVLTQPVFMLVMFYVCKSIFQPSKANSVN